MSNESNSPVSMDDVARYFNAPAALAALTNAEMIATLTEVHSWARDLPIPTRGACSAMQKVRAVRDALAAAPGAAQAGQVAPAGLHDAIMRLPATLPKGVYERCPAITYKEGHRDARHASAELAAGTEAGQVAVPEMTDEQIVAVWQSMPGGPDGWLKQFGYLQFARALLAAAPVPCAIDLLEEIAQSWDGCEYPDAMIKDIGAALRHDFARLAAAPAAPAQAKPLPADTIDTPEFRELLAQAMDAAELATRTGEPHRDYKPARDALLAHIDARLGAQASTAGERQEGGA